jgi:transcriptional regulator with XRE-family HTH domain
MRELVSQAEFARRIGVSPQYVSKMVKNGVIKLRSKKVDVQQATNALAATREPARSSSALLDGAVKTTSGDISSLSLEQLLVLRERISSSSPAEQSASQDLLDARLANERHKARLNELKVRREEGSLVDAEQVALDFANVAAIVQQKMRTIPVRIAAQVLACTTEAEARSLLSREIDIALSSLADGFTGDDDED